MNTPHIDDLLAAGWDLKVHMRSAGRYQASVYLGRLYDRDSHHHFGSSIVDAIEHLEEYVSSKSVTAVRRTEAR
jgi:hypothetical protein